MGSGGWRWWFRRECRAIASAEMVDGVFVVKLCDRWRWHGKGGCRKNDYPPLSDEARGG